MTVYGNRISTTSKMTLFMFRKKHTTFVILFMSMKVMLDKLVEVPAAAVRVKEESLDGDFETSVCIFKGI